MTYHDLNIKLYKIWPWSIYLSDLEYLSTYLFISSDGNMNLLTASFRPSLLTRMPPLSQWTFCMDIWWMMTCWWAFFWSLSNCVTCAATDPARCSTLTPYTWAEKFESFERINSIRETNGNFDSCNPCKRLVPSRLHELHESKFPFVSRIEFIRSKLSNFSAHVSGVTAAVFSAPASRANVRT